MGAEITPKWITFLLAFDVGYRKRRLRFLIEGQNRLSQMLGSGEFEGLDVAVVDRLKRKFYECSRGTGAKRNGWPRQRNNERSGRGYFSGRTISD